MYGIFTNANLLGTIAAVIKKTPSLQVIIYDGDAKDVKAGALKTIKASNPGIKIYTFEDFLKLGAKNPVEADPPSPEDLACIMYTSGSTGAPKGVLITNKNIVSAGSFCSPLFSLSSHCFLNHFLLSQSPLSSCCSEITSTPKNRTLLTSLSLYVPFAVRETQEK